MLTDYTGATRRLTQDRGLSLDPKKHGWMPKMDGCYARIATDRRGRITSILSRAGNTLATHTGSLLGRNLGFPSAVLHGELEWYSEAGMRAARTRGEPWIHLFDCTRALGVTIEREPYVTRYGWLHRWQAWEECNLDGAWQAEEHGIRDIDTGRWVRPAKETIRALPIVPLVRTKAAAELLWTSHVDRGGGEGLVAVRLDAPASARAAKSKIKKHDTLDCTVVRFDRSGAELDWKGHRFVVKCTGAINAQLSVGAIVEVKSDGFYETSITPRFARITRLRTDLMPAVLH